MSYGTAAGVAALAPRYANAAGRFDENTTPKLAHVTDWLTQVSAMLDVSLSGYGVETPVTVAAILPMLSGYANAQVAAMVRGVNGQGRFAEKPTTADEMLLIIGDATAAWVTKNIGGLGALLDVTPVTLATPTVLSVHSPGAMAIATMAASTRPNGGAAVVMDAVMVARRD
jgi:hypothetical protein